MFSCYFIFLLSLVFCHKYLLILDLEDGIHAKFWKLYRFPFLSEIDFKCLIIEKIISSFWIPCFKLSILINTFENFGSWMKIYRELHFHRHRFINMTSTAEMLTSTAHSTLLEVIVTDIVNKKPNITLFLQLTVMR